MFRKTDEVKVLRDPVHGYIHVDYEAVWQCINSAWFQRLRRIRQLGGAYMVYHTADHTRFGHSLGVYEIVRRMVTEVPDISNALTEREKLTVMLAGLMHDIGHGPYSHAFEKVSGTSHEEYTCRIIEEDPDMIFIVQQGNDTEGTQQALQDALTGNPAWAGLTAVKEDRVYHMDRKLFHFKPNNRWDQSYEQLEQILYGE